MSNVVFNWTRNGRVYIDVPLGILSLELDHTGCSIYYVYDVAIMLRCDKAGFLQYKEVIICYLHYDVSKYSF